MTEEMVEPVKLVNFERPTAEQKYWEKYWEANQKSFFAQPTYAAQADWLREAQAAVGSTTAFLAHIFRTNAK